MKTVFFGKKMILFLWMFGISVVLAGCSAQSFADSRAPGNPDFQKGKAFYGRKDYRTAVQYFERAVETNPQGWLFRNWLGMSYFNLREYAKARENLRISNRGRETAANSFYIGVSDYYLGDYDAALKDLGRSAEMFEEKGQDYDELHYYLGLTYLAEKRYSEAIAEFNRADMMKENVRNKAGLARAYMRLRDYDAALPYLKRWVAAEPDNEEARRLLDEAYRRLGAR